MGRRPNQVILQYFQRGPKLADNSNRYPQTCKLCGETFPKGRIDSLTTHLTKRCPAISEQERINACLLLNGISATRASRSALQSRQQQQTQQPQGHSMDLPLLQQQNWTPLETLAEVSRRQIDHLNEQGEDMGQTQLNIITTTESMSGVLSTTAAPAGLAGLERFEVQGQFSLENPPSTYNGQPQEKQGQHALVLNWNPAEDDLTFPTGTTEPEGETSAEEQIRSPHQAATASADGQSLTVAAAAAVRLNKEMLDPTLFSNLGEDVARALDTVQPTEAAAVPTPLSTAPENAAGPEHLPSIPRIPAPRPPPSSTPQQPWGEITYMSNTAMPPPSAPIQQIPGIIPMANKSVFRVDQNGTRSRHSRARFDETRRKEVQQVRKIGACIRCRILRKTCSQGNPCDTCRKVLSPRIWRSGCVRTKFTDELNIYNAGVQIVHCQKRINGLKSTLNLNHSIVVLAASHFPGPGPCVLVEALRGSKPKDPGTQLAAGDEQWATPQIAMIDDQEDLPGKLEGYVRDLLPEFSRKEGAAFSRTTVETALQVARRTDNRNLKLALELWGYVELIDRELKWDVNIRPSPISRVAARPITEEADGDLYKIICGQLTAAAERKASATSKALLTHIQRDLQDARVKIGHEMFFTVLVLLICVEKSTWAFKAWEEVDTLRQSWPLERSPSYYTRQGYGIAELLRMLLGIRKAMPKTAVGHSDDILAVEDPDPVLQSYFESINLKAADVFKQQHNPAFSEMNSRSLELHFCSILLMPYEEPPPGPAPPPTASSASAGASAGAGGS